MEEGLYTEKLNLPIISHIYAAKPKVKLALKKVNLSQHRSASTRQSGAFHKEFKERFKASYISRAAQVGSPKTSMKTSPLKI